MSRLVEALSLAMFIVGWAGVLPAAGQAQWKHLSSFSFDWDGHPGVRVTLSVPVKHDDPGDFTRVSLFVPGRSAVTFTNNSGWVNYRTADADVAKRFRTARNLIPSASILAIRASAARTLLLFFGYGYASSPGSLDVVEISSAGEIRRVLHGDEFGLKEVVDLNDDGVSEIVGYPCLSQEWGNGLLTYDPFHVYKLSSERGSPAKLSLPLSKEYNLKNYYGWAGPECSEELAVVLHPPGGGKPRVMKAKDAERLTNGSGRR